MLVPHRYTLSHVNKGLILPVEAPISSDNCCIMDLKVIRLPCKTGIVGGSDNLSQKSTPTGKVRAQQRTIYQFTLFRSSPLPSPSSPASFFLPHTYQSQSG